jgi:hypothetical protein
VSTPIGAAGRVVGDGVDIMLADDPERFADTAARVATDVASQERRARAGRAQADTGCGWDPLAVRLHALLGSVANDRTRAVVRSASALIAGPADEL